mgnify:CR=1 FL=1
MRLFTYIFFLLFLATCGGGGGGASSPTEPTSSIITQPHSVEIFEAKMGDGSKLETGFIDKMFSVGKRVLTGESIFMTHFTNSGQGKKRVAFASPYPGKIISSPIFESFSRRALTILVSGLFDNFEISRISL